MEVDRWVRVGNFYWPENTLMLTINTVFTNTMKNDPMKDNKYIFILSSVELLFFRIAACLVLIMFSWAAYIPYIRPKHSPKISRVINPVSWFSLNNVQLLTPMFYHWISEGSGALSIFSSFPLKINLSGNISLSFSSVVNTLTSLINSFINRDGLA